MIFFKNILVLLFHIVNLNKYEKSTIIKAPYNGLWVNNGSK